MALAQQGRFGGGSQLKETGRGSEILAVVNKHIKLPNLKSDFWHFPTSGVIWNWVAFGCFFILVRPHLAFNLIHFLVRKVTSHLEVPRRNDHLSVSYFVLPRLLPSTLPSLYFAGILDDRESCSLMSRILNIPSLLPLPFLPSPPSHSLSLRPSCPHSLFFHS